jgi:hypothetical protein
LCSAREWQGNAAQSWNKLELKKRNETVNNCLQNERGKMGKGTVEKFGLKAIADALEGSDVLTARDRLSQVVGAAVEVSGKVQKRVKRDGQCKLVIEPGASVPGFVVFADCLPDAEKVRARKIRKGSLVRVKGKFQTFGALAVCLSDCRLQGKR